MMNKLNWIFRILRFIPQTTPGKMRLTRFLIERFGPIGPCVIEAQGFIFKVPSVIEPIAQNLIAHGVYEPALLKSLGQVLKPNGVFFDVGANIGFFSILAAQRIVPEGKVASFEASPNVFECLEQNVRQSSSDSLRLFHRAVTERSGDKLEFFDAPDSKCGMGSLADRFGISRQVVESISLDDAAVQMGLDRVDVIKVDVEGFELGVLRGAKNLLSQKPAPHVFFEFNDWAENGPHAKPGDAQRYLQELGYTLVPMKNWMMGDLRPRDVQSEGSFDLVAFKI